MRESQLKSAITNPNSEIASAVKPDETKWETKIFAGGAVIAKEGATGPHWMTSDPVTGSTFTWRKIDNDWLTSVEETEPLGQKIYNADPDPLPEPSYDNSVGNADFPQWQCKMPSKFYGNFYAMPWHCQFAEIKRRSFEGGHYVIEEPETNPNKVSGHTTGSAGPATPTGSAGHEARHIMAFSRLMNFTLGATRKSTKETGEHTGDDEEELQNIGNLGILNIKADPEPLETEWVEPDTAFSSVTIAFNGLQDARNQLVGTLGNGECASKLDAVLSNLKLSDENLKKALGVQNSLRAKSILDLFDAIAGQKRGGFSFDLDETGFAALVDKIDPGTEFPAGGGGSTHASYDKGSNFLINAFMYVGVYPRTFTEGTPRRIQQARRALLGILIHELLHAAGTNRYFDHVEMDAAAKIVDPSVSGLERLVAKYCEVGTYVEKFDNR